MADGNLWDTVNQIVSGAGGQQPAPNDTPDSGSYGGTAEGGGADASANNDALHQMVENFGNLVGHSTLQQSPTVYDRLPEPLVYLGNQIAQSTKSNFNLDDDFQKFYSGLNTQDIADEEARRQAEADMQRLAAMTPTFDNSQAQGYLDQYQQEAQRQIAPPTMQGPTQPSLAAGLVALLGGFLDPKHAFTYGAAPFQEGLRQEDEQYKHDTLAYQQALADHQATLAGYRDAADMANRNALAKYQTDESAIQRQFQGAGQRMSEANQRVMSNDRAQQAIEKLLLTQQGKQDQAALNNAWKAYNGNGDLAQRRQAWQFLRTQKGLETLAEPTEQYSQELERLSKTGLNSVKADQITMLLPYRVQLMQSQFGLNDARAQKLAKETLWLDELNAQKVAQSAASIDNMRSMIQNRASMNSYRWARLAQDGWAKSQSSINAGLRSLSTQVNTLNASLRPLEKQVTSTNWGPRDANGRPTNPALASKWDDLNGRIKTYQTQIGDLQSSFVGLKGESDNIRTSLQNSGVDLNAQPQGEAMSNGGGSGWITPSNASRYTAQRWSDFGVSKDQLQADRADGRSSDYRALTNFATHFGFDVTSGFATSGHNDNSPHYRGFAVDVRTRNKTDQQIADLVNQANANGIRVLDERNRLPGEKVWSGPHLHLEFVNRGPIVSGGQAPQRPTALPPALQGTGGGSSQTPSILHPERNKPNGGAVRGRRSGATIQPIN